jgi:hypothetical protein
MSVDGRKRRGASPASGLPHFRSSKVVSELPDYLENLIVEERGSRNAVTYIYKDPNLRIAVSARMQRFIQARYIDLFNYANQILSRSEEKTLSEFAEELPAESDEQTDETARRSWVADIGRRKGYASREYFAASFLAASDELHMLWKGDGHRLSIAYAFADSWHWISSEFTGEHKLAAVGARAEKGRKQGPLELSTKHRASVEIVMDILRAYLSRESRKSRHSAKAAAGAILIEVNEALRSKRLRPYTEGSLRKLLRPFLAKARERF